MTDPSTESSPVPDGRRRLVRLAVLTIAVAILAGIIFLRPRAFTPRADPVSATLAPAPVAVAPGIYLLGKSSPAAVYLVETAKGLVLIDSGLEANAVGVLAQLAELRFDVQQLQAILLTHVHADHTMGAAHLRRLSGAKIYAGRADAQALRKGGPRALFFSTFHMPLLAAHPTTVDVELAGDETISFGKTRFAVLATPGHTPGSVCYLLERSDLRALFTGDVIQNLTRPRGGDMGTYAAGLAPHFGGDAGDYLATLRRLRALPVPNLVLPGHPRMDPAPRSPRLTQQEWHALLDVGIGELETLSVRFAADGANFLDGTPRELRAGLHYFGNVGPSAVYCLKTPAGLFLFDAPGGPELLELLTERFEKLGWKGQKLTAVLLTSGAAEATAGLTALVRQTACQVVAPKAALEDIQRRCPAGTKVLSAEDLVKSGWFEVEPIALQGRGTAPTAYPFLWAGKTVLVSGRIPVKPSAPALEELERDLGFNVAGYLRSLDRLAQVHPDLWLPAVPVHGQNANLYDRDWETVLAQNRRFVSRE